jgi:tetratricopeptide (TPR) repeat protein
MAVHFRAFNPWVHVTAGALAALLAGPMLCLALADEVDEARQICDSKEADPNDRIPACTRLLESGRKDIDVGSIYAVRANAWYLKGNFDNAIADYQAASNRNPQLISALQGLGNSYFRKAEFRSAIKAYSNALREKKSEDLYNNRGLAQLNVGEFRSAINDFGEAININPKFAPAYNGRGNAYTKIKQFEPAIEDFTNAVGIAPGFVDAYINRAEVLVVEKGDLDGGIRDYDKAINLDPKNWKAYSARGDALRLKGDLDRAMADHEEAIRLNPNDPESYGNRALTWKAKGDLDRAIADYDYAILLNPNYAPAYAGRGEILRLKGNLDLSLIDLDKAVSLNPKSSASLYHRGETLRESGALDKAIADYDEALRLIPGQAAVHTKRGLAYESKGNLVTARADFEKALKLPSESDAEHTKPAQEIARSHLAVLEAKEKAAREARETRRAPADLTQRFALDDPLRHGHALLIGNSHYKDRGWPQLDDIPLQLAQLEKGLKVHFDNVEVVQDIDAVPMLNKLNDFLRTYGNDSNARLFIYYAGHGYTEIQLNENRGYITGIDTPSLDGTQRARDQARPKAVSMAEIRAALERAPAKSILFMFDSCFSGTIFTNRSGPGIDPPQPLTPEVVARLMEKPARDIITAGQANEKVPAHSPIPELFLTALNGAADPYQLGVTSAVEIGTYLRNRVLQMRDINLTPLVGQLSNPAYTEGMFLFRVRNSGNAVDLPAARVPQPQSAVPRAGTPAKPSALRRH